MGGISGAGIVAAKASPAAMRDLPAACSWAATSSIFCPCLTMFWALWTMDARASRWLMLLPTALAFAAAARRCRSMDFRAALDQWSSLLPVAAAAAAALAVAAICARCMASRTSCCLAFSAALAAVLASCKRWLGCEGDRERLDLRLAMTQCQR
jgi:hypothetical protein